MGHRSTRMNTDLHSIRVNPWLNYCLILNDGWLSSAGQISRSGKHNNEGG